MDSLGDTFGGRIADDVIEYKGSQVRWGCRNGDRSRRVRGVEVLGRGERLELRTARATYVTRYAKT